MYSGIDSVDVEVMEEEVGVEAAVMEEVESEFWDLHLFGLAIVEVMEAAEAKAEVESEVAEVKEEVEEVEAEEMEVVVKVEVVDLVGRVVS